MKPNIHPKWYPNAQVMCACGHTWTVGATVKEIRTDVCYKCHPFFTGEQRIVDTEGQVDRFMRRLQAREEALRDAEKRQKKVVSTAAVMIEDLGLNARLVAMLNEAGLTKADDILARLNASGDEGLTDIRGLGLKALADLKRALRSRGYALPGDEAGEPAATAA